MITVDWEIDCFLISFIYELREKIVWYTYVKVETRRLTKDEQTGDAYFFTVNVGVPKRLDLDVADFVGIAVIGTSCTLACVTTSNITHFTE